MRVRVHDLELRLHDADGALLFLLLFLILLVIRDDACCLVSGSFRIFIGLLFFTVLLLSFRDIFLELRLTLGHVHVVDELVVGIHSNCHELGLTAVHLTQDVLHDLVIGREFLLVLGHDAVATIDSGVSDELLELGIVDEVGDVPVEHHIVSHAETALIVLVVLALADTVGKAPSYALLTISASNLLLLGLFDILVPTHIDEGLLIEERLLVVTDHLLRRCLDAEACDWLDQLGANRELTALLHLV